MSRRFRLQTLERLRSRALDDMAQRLAAAHRALVEAEEGARRAAEAVLACQAAARATPGEVTAAGIRRELLRERAERAAELVTARQDEVAEALTAWHGARAALRAVESLHERHRMALAEADARAEQRLTDDLAGIASSFASPGRAVGTGAGAAGGGAA
jgi:flagellar export protein FliJ